MNKHQENLVNYVDDLIRIYGYLPATQKSYCLTLDMLENEQLGKLAYLFLEADDRDTYDCFNNPSQSAINDDITCALIKMLKNNTKEARDDFAQLIYECSIYRYKKEMQQLIDERCSFHLHEIEPFDFDNYNNIEEVNHANR